MGAVAAKLVFRSSLPAFGLFFRVGQSCSVLDFNGFSPLVQCAGQAFCVEVYGLTKNEDFWLCGRWKRTLRGRVWMFSFVLLDGFIALVVAGCVCGGCGLT
jgi:hypothetical protein